MKVDKTPKTVGQRIRAERARRGMTQMQFAILTGTTPGDVSQIECGKQGIGVIVAVRIAKALDWSLDELLLGTGGEEE